MLLHRLASASAAVLLLLNGCSGDDGGSGNTAESPEPKVTAQGATDSPETLKVAPYIDVTTDPVDVDEVAAVTGQTDFTLAFLLADSSGSCTAAWDGKTALDDAAVAAQIGKIDALGGEVIIASGGATGTYLESVCTPEQLVTAYESALDTAGANRLDVDIEQEVPVDALAKALAALQQARGTAITLTVPVGGASDGLTDDGLALLKNAEASGIEVTVNAMTMNFSAAGGGWGRAMTLAAEAVKDDLATVWTDRSDEELYAMLGVTPMIGVNNTGGTTKEEDATYLLDWATEHGLGFVRFWSVNRDNGDCGNGTVAANCSGISQSRYQFTDRFHDFTG